MIYRRIPFDFIQESKCELLFPTQDPALPEHQGEGPPQSNKKKIKKKNNKNIGIIDKLRTVSSKRKTFYLCS